MLAGRVLLTSICLLAASPREAQEAAQGASTLEPYDRAPLALRTRALRGYSPKIAALALRGEPGGGFAVQALATPLPQADGASRVSVFVEIDGATFLDSSSADLVRGEVYVYALGADGAVGDYLAEVFAFDSRQVGEAIWQSGLKYYGELSLEKPGEYQLRVLVRSYPSEAAALQVLPLTVGPGSSPGLVPAFPGPSSRDAWIAVVGASNLDGAYPWVGGDSPISPAAKPVLVSERASELWLFTDRLPAGTARGQVELHVDGRRAGRADLEILERHEHGPSRPAALKVRLVTPELDAGVYDLVWRLDGGAGPLETTTPQVVVLGSGIREPDLLWTDLRWLLGGESQEDDRVAASSPAQEQPRGKRRGRKKKSRKPSVDKKLLRQLGQQYRQALGAGKGDPAASRNAVFDLESASLANPTPAALEYLRSAELAVIDELAAREVEALVPLMALHGQLYRAYRSRRLFSLMAHARQMVEDLAVRYAERGGTQGSRVTAARALTSLGGFLQEANLPSSSRRLFKLAVQHDPRNDGALLGLATSYEKYGNYSDAGHYLDLLEEAAPRNEEGLLRLAINRRRQGDRLQSLQILEKLSARKGTPEWVRSLAYQELARGWVDQGNLQRAIEVLEKAVTEGVQSSDARMLLAYAYDRAGSTERAFDVIELVSASAGRASARQTYDSWPTASLEKQRKELAEAASVRWSTLASLLGGGGEETGP